MLRRTLFLAVLLTASFVFAADPPKPNIVLIFVDDMGYGDAGCYGNDTIKTPNLDRMAAEGQRWTSFYSSGATCVPSRRGLNTGRHPMLMGKANFVPIRDTFIAAMLKKQGYATALLGKWHLAGYPKDFTTSPMHPLECGFDYHFGTPGSNDVPAPPGRKQNRALFDECKPTTFPVPLIRGREVVEMPVDQSTLTKRYTEEAVKWIGENKDTPFYLYLAHNMPHAPVFASKAFQGKSKGGVYGDVIEEIDWSVGQVMAAVKDAGVDKKTLIIFTSDNGPWTMFEVHGGTAGPLRGEKGTSWEGGFRVPGIFRWPGKIKPGTVDGLAANLDLYATFATLAGGDEPKDLKGYISKDLTGTLLRGELAPRKKWLYGPAFRSGNYKIHLATKARSSNPDTRKREPMANHNPPLLFNLKDDMAEQNNIAAQSPEIVDRLLKEMQAFKATGK
jgi:arylsulfatase A-like enzyme